MPRFLTTEGLARFSTRRPWVVVSIWVIALVAAVASAASIGGVLTTEAESYRESESSNAEAILEERFFGAQPAEEFVLVHSDSFSVDDPAFTERAQAVIAELRAIPGIEVLSFFETGAPTLVSASRTTLLVPVVITAGDIEAQAEEVLHAIEPLNAGGFTVVTGGEGSISVAFNETSESDLQTAELIGLPIALLILVVVFGALVAAGVPFVLGLSFVILLMVFRSIVVPIKAIIMNLLSVGAAYGLMVLVFQHGVGADLLGFQQVERIESWVPLFMFAILFGLSMDYHVFLLTRIRERFDQTGDNAESVAFGVRTTAGLITGAALIMVAVFTGFAMGEMVMFQQFGFGLAVAVLLDATIVRSVLVPASMALLGNANWYLPSWLGWLPHINVEGSHEPHPAPVLQPDF